MLTSNADFSRIFLFLNNRFHLLMMYDNQVTQNLLLSIPLLVMRFFTGAVLMCPCRRGGLITICPFIHLGQEPASFSRQGPVKSDSRARITALRWESTVNATKLIYIHFFSFLNEDFRRCTALGGSEQPEVTASDL